MVVTFLLMVWLFYFLLTDFSDVGNIKRFNRVLSLCRVFCNVLLFENSEVFGSVCFVGEKFLVFVFSGVFLCISCLFWFFGLHFFLQNFLNCFFKYLLLKRRGFLLVSRR